MIDVIAQTPIEYSKQSRDYQVIARLYTALYNLSKMYIDDMSVWDANIDNKLSHLRAKTLNFHPKHAWDYDTLDAAVSCLKYLVMRKGTKPAIEDCVIILQRVNNLKGRPEVDVDYNTYTINIKIPKQLASMGVVEDLLELIIPIGMGYRIMEYELLDEYVEDNFEFSDQININTNMKILPTYKMGIGGRRMGEVTTETPYPSLHIAPGVIGEVATIDDSVWPDDNNRSQGALIHYNLVTTMGEVRDSHGETVNLKDGDTIVSSITDNTEDDNTEEKTWKKKKPRK